MDYSFLLKASGIVFRESLEAVLIYGIIISFFRKSSGTTKETRAATLGLILGVVASILLGYAFAGVTPLISAEFYSLIEICIIFGGSLLMLYMVFWMAEHSKTLKKDIESNLSKAVSAQSLKAITGTVFVAVVREGVETVIYLYSLSLESSSTAHKSSILLSLVIGVALSFLVYQLMIHGSKLLSTQVIFKITGTWLLVSSSSLIATGFDKLFSAGYFEKMSEVVFNIEPSGLFLTISNFAESIIGLRFQPSLLHLISFILFWGFVIYKDPLKYRKN